MTTAQYRIIFYPISEGIEIKVFLLYTSCKFVELAPQINRQMMTVCHTHRIDKLQNIHTHLVSSRKMLPAVTVRECLEERELESVGNSIRVIKTYKKGKETNIDGFCNSKDTIKERQHDERNEEKRARLDNMKKYLEGNINGEKKQMRNEEPD